MIKNYKIKLKNRRSNVIWYHNWMYLMHISYSEELRIGSIWRGRILRPIWKTRQIHILQIPCCKSMLGRKHILENGYKKGEEFKLSRLSKCLCWWCCIKFKGSVDSKGKIGIILTEEEFEMAINTYLNSR